MTDCSSEHLCFNSTAPDEAYAFIGDVIQVLAVLDSSAGRTFDNMPSGYPFERTRYYGDQDQTKTRSNILLASLAGTDLAMGLTSQPAFIAMEISRLADGPLSVHGTLYSITPNAIIVLCLASIFHLVLLGQIALWR